MFARVLRVVAVALLALFGIGGGLFIAGETLADPGGWQGALLVTVWVVPMVGLSLAAAMRPEFSGKALPVVLAVVAGLTILDSFAHFVDRDEWGPVGTITMFAILIPCGVLGARRAARGGGLLMAGSAAQFVATVVGMDREGGQSVSSALGGSSGVLVVPFLVLGALFLAVAAAERKASGHAHSGMPKLGHAH